MQNTFIMEVFFQNKIPSQYIKDPYEFWSKALTHKLRNLHIILGIVSDLQSQWKGGTYIKDLV